MGAHLRLPSTHRRQYPGHTETLRRRASRFLHLSSSGGAFYSGRVLVEWCEHGVWVHVNCAWKLGKFLAVLRELRFIAHKRHDSCFRPNASLARDRKLLSKDAVRLGRDAKASFFSSILANDSLCPMILDTSRLEGSFPESNAHTRQGKNGLDSSPLHYAAIHVVSSATQSLKYEPARSNKRTTRRTEACGSQVEIHPVKFSLINENWC